MAQKQSGSEFSIGFMLGFAIGAGAALFLAPQPGPETRTQLKERGNNINVKALQDKAKTQAQVLRERGKDAVNKAQNNVSKIANQRNKQTPS